MVNQTYFHTVAFFGSITNGVADVQLNLVADQIVTPNSSSQMIMPQQGQLRLGTGGSANLQRLKINSASLRTLGLPYIAPVNAGLTVPSPPNVWDPGRMGPTIRKSDALFLQATQSGGVAENGYGLLWLYFGRQEIPQGDEYNMRFTGTITGSAGLWVNGPISLEQPLPAGVYAITGVDVQGTNLVAARFAFPGASWRPGVLCRNTLTSVPKEVFTRGDLGVFGTFDSVNTPSMDIFVTGANTAQEGYLNLVRLGDR